MKDIILYIISAMIIAFIFKFSIGLITSAIAFLFMAILGFKEKKIELVLEKYPKIFITYSVLLNVLIGIFYYAIILTVTISFISKGGNHLVYMILSLIWGISILTGATGFFGILFLTCPISLIFDYLGIGNIVGFLWIAVIIASLAYYYGRVDIIKEQMRSSFD
jgi:hypothetical protein